MNRSFKTIWNAVRGQLVVVNEATAGHAQCGGTLHLPEGGESAAAPVAANRPLGRVAAGLLSLAVMATFAAGANAAAVVTDPADAWGIKDAKHDNANINIELAWAGGTYGGSANPADNYNVIVGANGGFLGGTYYFDDLTSTFFGEQYKTGTFYAPNVYNQGTMHEAGPTIRKKDGSYIDQIAGTYWMNGFYNADTAKVDIGHVRISNLLANKSQNFKLASVMLKSGGQIQNDGVMELGDVYTGVGNATVFSDHTLSAKAPTLSQAEDDAGSFKNSGTVKITGTFSNYVALTDSDTGTWEVKTWVNHADAALNEVSAEKLTHAAGKNFQTMVLTVADTLTNAGTIESGAMTLNKVANAGTITGNGVLTASDTVTNSGTITATNFTAKSLTNTGGKASVTATGKVELASGLSNAAGSTVKGKSVVVQGGASTNAGTVTATDGVTISGDFTSTGTINAGKKLTAAADSTVKLQGATTAESLTLQGGTVEIASADVSVDGITSSGSSTLRNNQAVHIDAFGSTQGLTYEQTAGTISAADNSWFKYATLNIKGGTITRTNAGADSLGSNTVTISGATPLGSTDGSHLDNGWENGQTVVSVGRLDSMADVTLSSGGLLKAQSVALSSKSLTFDGGALATSLDQMFKGVAAATYTITTGEDGHLSTSVLGAASVDGIADAFKNNIAFTNNGGTFVITDKVVSVKAIGESSKELKTLAGDAAKNNISVVYTGTAASDTGASTIFSQATYNSLKAEQAGTAGSNFLTPGLVFATMTYENSAAEGQATRANLVVGNKPTDVPEDTFYLDNSIGFKNVTGAANVAVKDGREFTLVGDTTNEIALLADANTATVTGTGSVFSLGTKGVAKTKGKLAKVTVADGGAFKVKNGAYTVTALTDAAGTTVDVDTGAKLTLTNGGTLAGNYAAKGELVVNGKAVITGKFVNEGTTTFTAEGNSLSGTFANNAGTVTFKKLDMTNAFTTAANAKTVFEDGFTISAAMKGEKAMRNVGRVVSKGANAVNGGYYISDAGSATVLDGATVLDTAAGMSLSGDSFLKTVEVKNGSRLVIGDNTLFITEGLTGDATATVQVGEQSTVAFYTLSNRGIFRQAEGVTLSVGDAASYDLLTDPDRDVAARTTALLGSDATLRDPSATTKPTVNRANYTGDEVAASFFAMPRMTNFLMTSLAADFGAGEIVTPGENETTKPAEPQQPQNSYAGGDITTTHIISGTKWSADGELITETPSVAVAGDVNVKKGGNFTGYDEVVVNDGVKVAVENGGAAKFTSMTDQMGDLRKSELKVHGSVEVADGGVLGADSLVLEEGGSFVTVGRAGGDKLTLADSASLTTRSGSETTFAAADLKGGSIVVEGGYLGFGLDAASARKATEKNAVLGLGLVAFDGSKASIQVGTLAPETTLQAGDLYFGADSALVLSTVQLGEHAALKGSGRLTVKKGSEFSVVSAAWGKHVVVSDGYDLSGMDKGAWEGVDFKNLSGKELTLGVESGKLILTAGGESIKDSGLDIVAPDVIDGLISDVTQVEKRDTESKFADVRFVARVLEDVYGGTDAEKVKTWNSVAQLGVASGYDAYVLDESVNLFGTIEGRATGAAAAAPAAGNGLFAQVLGRTTEADDLDTGSGFKAGYDADSYGVMAGFESSFGSGFKAGLAMAYVDTDLDGKGDFAKTTTDAKVWGGLGYLGYAFADGWQVTGTAGLLKASGDVEQSIAPAMGFGKATTDLDSLTFGLGVRADKTFDLGFVSVTPHAGLRWVMTKADGYDVKLDGETAFRTDDETTNLLQIPVGVSVAGAFEAGSWTFKPYADLTVTANAGDTDRETKLSAVNYSGVDTFKADVAGKVAGELSLGVQGGTDAFGFRIGGSAVAGDAGRQSYALTGSVQWKF